MTSQEQNHDDGPKKIFLSRRSCRACAALRAAAVELGCWLQPRAGQPGPLCVVVVMVVEVPALAVGDGVRLLVGCWLALPRAPGMQAARDENSCQAPGWSAWRVGALGGCGRTMGMGMAVCEWRAVGEAVCSLTGEAGVVERGGWVVDRVPSVSVPGVKKRYFAVPRLWMGRDGIWGLRMVSGGLTTGSWTRTVLGMTDGWPGLVACDSGGRLDGGGKDRRLRTTKRDIIAAVI